MPLADFVIELDHDVGVAAVQADLHRGRRQPAIGEYGDYHLSEPVVTAFSVPEKFRSIESRGD